MGGLWLRDKEERVSSQPASGHRLLDGEAAGKRLLPDEVEISGWPQLEEEVHHNDSEHVAPLITRYLPISAKAPAIARETLTNLSETLTSDLLRDAQLLISELVAHRVRRLPVRREGSLRLDVTVSQVGVRVQVADDDRGSAPPPIDSDEPAIGWELQIVAQIADRWGIRRNELTTIWFELDR